MVPSQYRGAHSVSGLAPGDEDFEIWSSLLWCQLLYDYFVSQGKKPVLVEAQDFIYNTEPIMTKVCRELGIDENGWSDKWDPVPAEYWPDHEIGNAMTGALMSSAGIERRLKEVSPSSTMHS
jgi:hypothetical protein